VVSARLLAGVAGVLLLGIGAGVARPAGAEEPTPVGRWTTIDDKTGKPSSVVSIREENGRLEGRVESVVVAPGEDPEPRCTKCDGALKGRPIVGMTILWGLTRDGRRWSGGRILDPDEGSTYRCRVEVVEGGAKLEVRGYLGIALLGRTQTWIRAR
jgi:uncharacterized protein (DUF2147 family)